MATLYRLFVSIAFLLSGGLPKAASLYEWPSIIPTTREFSFEDSSQARAEVSITGVDGRPLYVLLCIGWGRFREDPHFDHSGDFECRLTSTYSRDHYSTLLTENPRQERSWESRGRFMTYELVNNCAKYPEYGAVRNFRLRGMRIRLQLTNLHFGPGNKAGENGKRSLLSSFSLVVRVESDPGAFSAIAEEVPVAYPHPMTNGSDVVNSLDCTKSPAKHVRGDVAETYIKDQGLGPPYPDIIPTTKTGTFPGSNEDFGFADKPLPPRLRGFYMPISGKDRSTAYEFECSSTSPIMRWGISCGLFAKGKPVNLLADSTDPYSRLDRSTIFPEQIEGVCASYPDWGAERIFLLRGFRLTVRLSHPQFIPSDWDWYGKGIKQVQINVEVHTDGSAESPVAAFPRYAYWGFLFRNVPFESCKMPIANPWFINEH